MTLFEYLAAAFTLLFSFAAARLVGGLPEAIVPGRRYWVHLVMVAGAGLTIAIAFWAFWSYRDVDWTLPRFLLAMASPLLVLLTASTIIPAAPERVGSWREYYYAVRFRYFVSWIVLGLSMATITTVLLDMPLFHPARFPQGCVVTLGSIGSATSNPRVHAGLAVACLGALVVGIFVVMADPGALTR